MLRVRVFDAFWCPKQPASQPASVCSLEGWVRNVSESERFRDKINTILVDDHFGNSPPLLCCLGVPAEKYAFSALRSGLSA